MFYFATHLLVGSFGAGFSLFGTNKVRTELQLLGLPPTFALMQGKWKRFGAFLLAVVAIVAAITLGTRGQSLSTGEVIARVALVGVLSYLLTFLFWPRRSRRSVGQRAVPQSSARPGTPRADRPVVDERPVAVIQPRPAGSRPGSRVHIPETPTERNPRGRRRDTRQAGRDFQWPAQR